MIFDMVAAEDEAVYCHTKRTPMTVCGLILLDRRSSREFKTALYQRRDQFKNHRITVDYKLPTGDFPQELPTVDFTLPACATGLHLSSKIDKHGIFSKADDHIDPYYFDADEYSHLRIFARTIKAAFNRPKLEKLLLEVAISDPSVTGEWKSRHIYAAKDVYRQIMKDLDTIVRDKCKTHVALIMHDSTGFLARRRGNSAAKLRHGPLWTRDYQLKKCVVRLLDNFQATERVQRALQDGPCMKKVEKHGLDTDSDWDDQN
ncbi:unnamed protein product [Zymoseptoria tritici ST99CH_3D1]|uniref:Uncharacterized protein n=1 Tax=Zymoseptoria tritici ST99CH_1E4 TaxID=1276532 RepID=A0A2H1GPQ7_ZYMTR|nr:unnamed protein product [Zymoseptoria tritici ST99CH_1E4]SMR57964.1 unnamed protein product [Zymoseptoria tritici ST99CH_3D1]